MGGTDHTPYDYNLTLSLTRLSGPDNCIVLCVWTNMAAKFVFKIALFLILASIVISFHKFMLCTMYQVPQILSPLSNPTMVFFHVKLNYCFEDHSICMEQALPPLNNQSFCFVFISAEWKITQVKRESNMKSPFCVGAEFPSGQQHSIFGPRVRAIIHCISAHVLSMACWTC